tara:strand:+ start:116 stop:631 length:516 start_codon:yes stop_codon:yes gene_type:complete
MKRMTLLILAALALNVQAATAAEEWGIEHEEKARFEAKVVDVLCELSGDCPANCGDGKRQLGLLDSENKLHLAIKNVDPFAGTVVDLLPYCGKQILADGLLIANPKLPMFVLQFKRELPDGKWSRANWFTRDWATAHPDLDKDEWFRKDPLIEQVIAEDGVFGIPGLQPEE